MTCKLLEEREMWSDQPYGNIYSIHKVLTRTTHVLNCHLTYLVIYIFSINAPVSYTKQYYKTVISAIACSCS